MLYSFTKETGHERAQIKKNKLWDNTHQLSPHPHPDMYQSPPHLSHAPIIHNNNTMDTESLVQMRQSNKCGSVRNDEIFNLHLGSDAGPWVTIPYLLQDTSHIYWFHPPKQLTRKKQRSQKWDSSPNKLFSSAILPPYFSMLILSLTLLALGSVYVHQGSMKRLVGSGISLLGSLLFSG